MTVDTQSLPTLGLSSGESTSRPEAEAALPQQRHVGAPQLRGRSAIEVLREAWRRSLAALAYRLPTYLAVFLLVRGVVTGPGYPNQDGQ